MMASEHIRVFGVTSADAASGHSMPLELVEFEFMLAPALIALYCKSIYDRLDNCTSTLNLMWILLPVLTVRVFIYLYLFFFSHILMSANVELFTLIDSKQKVGGGGSC
jgi:hypothetical protein